MAVPKDPREVETADPFRALFPIDPTVRDLVGSSIRENGYDPSKPLLCWRDAYGERGRTICIDGHTRLSLAIEFGLDSVPVTMRRFDSVDAAIAAAIGEQAQRRNLNPSQLAIHVLTMLDRFDNDGFHGQGARNDLYGRSAKDLAEMVGVTSRTIERARQLIAIGDDALIAQVRAGEIGLKTAVEAGKQAERDAAIRKAREWEPSEELKQAHDAKQKQDAEKPEADRKADEARREADKAAAVRALAGARSPDAFIVSATAEIHWFIENDAEISNFDEVQGDLIELLRECQVYTAQHGVTSDWLDAALNAASRNGGEA